MASFSIALGCGCWPLNGKTCFLVANEVLNPASCLDLEHLGQLQPDQARQRSQSSVCIKVYPFKIPRIQGHKHPHSIKWRRDRMGGKTILSAQGVYCFFNALSPEPCDFKFHKVTRQKKIHLMKTQQEQCWSLREIETKSHLKVCLCQYLEDSNPQTDQSVISENDHFRCLFLSGLQSKNTKRIHFQLSEAVKHSKSWHLRIWNTIFGGNFHHLTLRKKSLKPEMWNTGHRTFLSFVTDGGNQLVAQEAIRKPSTLRRPPARTGEPVSSKNWAEMHVQLCDSRR